MLKPAQVAALPVAKLIDGHLTLDQNRVMKSVAALPVAKLIDGHLSKRTDPLTGIAAALPVAKLIDGHLPGSGRDAASRCGPACCEADRRTP